MAEDDHDRVWKLMEKNHIAMLITHDGEAIRSRPMGATVKRDENAIYFLTDVRRHKDDEIRSNPNVAVAFSDTGGQKYVSVSGRAQVSNDRAKIKELWTPLAKAWWESASDPNIRVLVFTPHDAEYWDSPGKIVSYVAMLTAAVTGAKPKVGENRKVAM